jgi:MFS family permease
MSQQMTSPSGGQTGNGNNSNNGAMLDQGGRSIVALMTALMVAIFAFQLNASMLSPALATMERELNTTSDQIGLTQTVFFTAAALFSLFLPRLADLVGRKKVLLGILIATTLGCVVSALAPNVTVLMIGRILQGAAGPVVPMCLIMLHVRVTEEKRYAKLMSILTSVNGGIAGIDAILGGWLAGNFGFRSVFWTMAVIGLVAIVLVGVAAEESTAQDTPRMDWLGVVCLGIAFLAAYLAINEIQKLGAANWLLSTTLLTMTGVFAIMNGVIPAIAQDMKLWSGMGADVVSFATLTPYAIVGLLFGIAAGQLASRFGYLRVLRVGLVVSLLGALFGIVVAHDPSVWILVAISVLLGLSYAGTANIMLNGLGIVLSPKDNTGYLPGMNAGAFNLGAGLSFAVLYAFMTSLSASHGSVAGYSAAMIAGAVLLVAAFGCSYLIPQPEDERE